MRPPRPPFRRGILPAVAISDTEPSKSAISAED
eukprot:CAMPEP_0197703114 /NCGR_PEP_ID=MMETSP1338-20131121/125275_1 /TAXON_ID=43686 ORGANISM="Pelagodinium beii, Strain RCC1491" /NCGR_SAMPLE_ID=MMETSP1338 /ASSEMBLY_ACC=CAM_ASM_000754 /LENGTH=32 /DNA_ID= /DNA_START= /DNA_END= /DNA_ORIENTATION=